MYLVKLRTKASDKLIGLIKKWAFIKELNVYFRAMGDTKMQEIIIGLTISIKKYSPHKLHYIQKLVLIINKMA